MPPSSESSGTPRLSDSFPYLDGSCSANSSPTPESHHRQHRGHGPHATRSTVVRRKDGLRLFDGGPWHDARGGHASGSVPTLFPGAGRLAPPRG